MTTTELKALELRCNRCGHRWLRRSAKEPNVCPACKSTRWNQPRVRKIAPQRKAVRRG
jgi:predicted Zn-ribbon and HTH transcriptional regulator